jgi:hypothetical protein
MHPVRRFQMEDRLSVLALIDGSNKELKMTQRHVEVPSSDHGTVLAIGAAGIFAVLNAQSKSR